MNAFRPAAPIPPTVPGQVPADNLVPETEVIFHECSRFRILLVGKVGSGKSSLIDRIFGTKDKSQHTRRREATIEHAFESDANRRCVLHDSTGYEAGESEDFAKLKKFVNENSQGPESERLHAIWLCISIPYYGCCIFRKEDELLLKMLSKFNRVPLIVVFTILDDIILRHQTLGLEPAVKRAKELVERMYSKQKCSRPFVCVSTIGRYEDTLEELTDITMEQLEPHVPSQYGLGSQKGTFFRNLIHRRPKYKLADDPDNQGPTNSQVLLVTAQRINPHMKLRTSIRIGKRKYWQNLLASAFFEGRHLEDCFRTIHQDIVVVWNFNHVVETYMLGDEFINTVSHIVDDISPRQNFEAHNAANEPPSKGAVAHPAGLHLIVAGVPADAVLSPWLLGVYQQTNDILRCMMASIVALVLIMEMLFESQSCIKDGVDQLHPTAALNVVEDYEKSDLKKAIHVEIRRFVGNGAAAKWKKPDLVMEKITDLIMWYHMGGDGYERWHSWRDDDRSRCG